METSEETELSCKVILSSEPLTHVKRTAVLPSVCGISSSSSRHFVCFALLCFRQPQETNTEKGRGVRKGN